MRGAQGPLHPRREQRQSELRVFGLHARTFLRAGETQEQKPGGP